MFRWNTNTLLNMELSILDTNLTATETTLKAITEGSLNDLDARLISSTNKIVRYSASAVSGDYLPDNQTNGTGFWIFHPSLILELVADGYDHTGNSKTDVSEFLTLYRDYVSILCSDYNHVGSLAAESLTAKTWALSTNESKLYATNIFIKEDSASRATDYANKIAFLQTYPSAISEPAAITLWNAKWAVHHHKDIASCYSRWHSDAMHLVLAKYLTLDDIELFFDASFTHASKFILEGLKTDLLNYINATLTTEAWTPKDSQTLSDMKDEILLVIDSGIH